MSVDDRAAAYAKGEINRLRGVLQGGDDHDSIDNGSCMACAVVGRVLQVMEPALASAFVVGYAAALDFEHTRGRIKR